MAPPQQLELVSPLAETGGDGRAPGQPGVVGTKISLLTGDCLEQMRLLPDASVDCITTDPPYGLSKEPDVAEVLRHWLAGDDYIHRGGGFMGKSWDSFVPGPAVWREAFRVLKPGGHLLAFFGTRTYDLGTMAVRLAGFEIRDQLAWMYANGLPKSKNVGRELGHESRTALGTALKPAHEPIVMARKPLAGTVVATVLEHGTGALNIDACRVAGVKGSGVWGTSNSNRDANNTVKLNGSPNRADYRSEAVAAGDGEVGRWPANVILDEEAARSLDGQAGASRYYFVAKPKKRERNAGLAPGERNTHNTVKPITLMQHLIRLVCPPGGTVLDPYLGSGTTGCAAVLEPCVGRFIGIEREPEYARIAQARITHWAGASSEAA